MRCFVFDVFFNRQFQIVDSLWIRQLQNYYSSLSPLAFVKLKLEYKLTKKKLEDPQNCSQFQANPFNLAFPAPNWPTTRPLEWIISRAINSPARVFTQHGGGPEPIITITTHFPPVHTHAHTWHVENPFHYASPTECIMRTCRVLLDAPGQIEELKCVVAFKSGVHPSKRLLLRYSKIYCYFWGSKKAV